MANASPKSANNLEHKVKSEKLLTYFSLFTFHFSLFPDELVQKTIHAPYPIPTIH
jgi:hypothetical protein